MRLVVLGKTLKYFFLELKSTNLLMDGNSTEMFSSKVDFQPIRTATLILRAKFQQLRKQPFEALNLQFHGAKCSSDYRSTQVARMGASLF